MEFYEDEPTEIDHHVVDSDPFDLPNLLKIHITTRGKSKSNLVSSALKHFGPGNPVVWSADGRNTSMAVACAEILKTKCKFKTVYQNTQICEMKTIEVWNPLQENVGLDPLRVVRSVPIIHVLVSVDPLDESMMGSQTSNRTSNQRRTVGKSSITSTQVPQPSVDAMSRSPSSPSVLSSSL